MVEHIKMAFSLIVGMVGLSGVVIYFFTGDTGLIFIGLILVFMSLIALIALLSPKDWDGKIRIILSLVNMFSHWNSINTN